MKKSVANTNSENSTELGDTMTAAIYLRKSRAEERTDTIEETLCRHKETLLSYASKTGLVIVAAYEEVVSGESLFSRPQMLKLLADVEENKYDAILCMDIDRLGRGGMKDQGIILDTFKQSGTKIITPEKIYDLNDDMDEELTEFKTFMSRRELKIINKRLRRGLKQTINDGGYIANAPYGYNKVYKDKRPTLEINESEAYFVRMMFDMYVQGNGCPIIAETINALGAKPHRSESFSRSSVRHIINNPTFIGKIVWDQKQHIRKGSKGSDKNFCIYNPREKWTIVDGIHPAIVSEEIYNEVQRIMKGRYIPSQNDGTIKSPLAGLVTCKQCGKRMQRMGASNNNPYLLCNTKGCVAGVKFHLAESLMLDALAAELQTIEIDLISKKVIDVSGLENSLAAVQRELQTLQSQQDKLQDLLEQGVYDVATYKRRLGLLHEKQEQMQLQTTNLEDKIRKAKSEDKRILAEKIKNVLATYDGSDAAKKNTLLKSVVETSYYYKAKKSKMNDFTIEVKFRSY